LDRVSLMTSREDVKNHLVADALFVLATSLNVWFYMVYYFGIPYRISIDGFATFFYVIILFRFWVGTLASFYRRLTG